MLVVAVNQFAVCFLGSVFGKGISNQNGIQDDTFQILYVNPFIRRWPLLCDILR